MAYKFLSDDSTGAVAVERWYDRSERAWVLRFVDANGYQVGPAEYIGNGREAADKVEAQMREAADGAWLVVQAREGQRKLECTRCSERPIVANGLCANCADAADEDAAL